MKTCEGCSKQFKEGTGLVCAKCKKNYHVKCVNMTTAQFNRLKNKCNWNCPTCPSRNSKFVDTPARGSVSAAEESSNSDSSPTQQKYCETATTTLAVTSLVGDCQPLGPSQNELLRTISLQISELQTQMSSIHIIKNDLSSLKKDISELKGTLSAKIEHLDNRMSDVEFRLSRVSEFQSELNELKTKVSNITEGSLKNDQWVRRSNIQLNGIPAQRDEDLIKVIQILGEKCGYNLEPSRDLDFITRVAVRNDVDNSYPKPIIVKMLSRYKKDDFLSCLRRLKNLKASDIGFPGNQTRIYINDHLSSYNKMLLQKAKALAKEKKYEYCWVRNCTVMVRLNEKSKIIHITSEDSLNKIV